MKAFERLGAMVGGSARKTFNTAAGTVGLAHWALEHPLQTTAVLGGGYAVASYGNNRTNAIPAGPAVNEIAPGRTQSRSNYDLGASGDLVFALHRLNH